MTPDRRILLVLFALAVGVRIAYVAVIETQPDINPGPFTYEYRTAERIATGTPWVRSAYSPVAPVYSLILAAAFTVTGAHAWVAYLLNAIFGAIVVLVAYRFGVKLLTPHAEKRGWLTPLLAGIVGALWLALYVHHVHFTSLVTRDTLVATLLLMLAYLLAQPFHKMRNAIWTAVVYAVLIHVDPQFLLFAPLLIIFMLVWATHHRLLNVQYVFLFLSASFLLSLPWTARNYVVYREFVPVSLEAVRYIRPVTDRLFPTSPAPETVRDAQRENPPNPGIRDNTIEFWRVARFTDGTGPGAAGELAWSLRHNAVNIVNYGLLLPFFLYGLYAAFRNRSRGGLVLAGIIVVYFLIRVKYGGNERARLPIEPMIILLGVYGLNDLVTSIRALRSAPGRSAPAD